jgi:hypothetical protein
MIMVLNSDETLEKIGKELLGQHDSLCPRLLHVPDQRTMVYREDVIDGRRIGKPRFDPPMLSWGAELLASLRDHLQAIWNYLQAHSYWFDPSIKELLVRDSRRESKASVIFLLERDVWATDEVYGDYLIEEISNSIRVSYFRREQRRKTRELGPLTNSKLKEWILDDAKNQIKDQFTHLWEKLRTEIQTSMEEGFHKLPSKVATRDDIIAQFKACEQIKSISPEAALLQLGRVAEWWLLHTLGHVTRRDYADLVRLAETAGFLNKNQARLFAEVRSTYNSLKHDTRFILEPSVLDGLLVKFEKFINVRDGDK